MTDRSRFSPISDELIGLASQACRIHARAATMNIYEKGVIRGGFSVGLLRRSSAPRIRANS